MKTFQDCGHEYVRTYNSATDQWEVSVSVTDIYMGEPKPRIPQHAQAFVSVLRLAAERIERGESVQDVVRGMALHDVVMALSGLV